MAKIPSAPTARRSAAISCACGRLISVATLDTSVTLFGRTYESPIALAPIGSQRAFHPDAEGAVARAARARKHLQILSTVSSTSVETVNAERGEPVWYQLYPTNDWQVTTSLVTRVEKSGCAVLVLTVDNLGNNRLTQARMTLGDPRACDSCHAKPGPRYFVVAADVHRYRPVPGRAADSVRLELGLHRSAARDHEDEDRAQGYRDA